VPVDPSAFVHPNALCESTEVGANTRIWPFAHVMKGATLGSDCNICDHVFVESDVHIGNAVTIKLGVELCAGVTLEDYVFVGPQVAFTNDLWPRVEFKTPPEEFLPTRVCRGASIGGNVTIICGVTIGTYAFVGAGAVVTADVPAYSLVVGNPARHVGWICACTKRLPDSLVCECGRSYRRAGDAIEPV